MAQSMRNAAIASAAALLLSAMPAKAQQPITLDGAVQFNDEHAFNKSLLKFQELTQKYYGKPINFVLHRNSELGLEKDYFAYMNQGISVDYAIVSPSHMSTFARAAPLMDMPFLFRDLAHWNKVLDGDALQPIADEVAKKADVMLVGYAGGGVRNIIANKPVRNMAELKGLSLRVMGAPIQTTMFQAIGAAPTVIAYNEVYNAIQTGVIQGAENEAAGLDADEVLRSGAGHFAHAARDHGAADRVLAARRFDVCRLSCKSRDPESRQGSRASSEGRSGIVRNDSKRCWPSSRRKAS